MNYGRARVARFILALLDSESPPKIRPSSQARTWIGPKKRITRARFPRESFLKNKTLLPAGVYIWMKIEL